MNTNQVYQVLQITVNKNSEDIKQLITENLKNVGFTLKKYNNEDCIFYKDPVNKLLNGVETYLKIYIKDGVVTVLGWAITGSKIYALSNNFHENIDLEQFQFDAKKTGSLVSQLYTFQDIFKEFTSNIKCYSISAQELPNDMGESFIPDLTIDKNIKIKKNLTLEIILDIVSIPLFFLIPVASCVLTLISITMIYYAGDLRSQKISSKIVYIISIVLLIIYIILLLASKIIEVLNL